MSSGNGRPTGRIYAPDSSPISTERAISGISSSSAPRASAASASASSSGSRLHSAMQGKKSSFGSSFANSLKARSGNGGSGNERTFTAPSTIKSAVPTKARLASPLQSAAPSSSSKAIPGLDRFRYAEREGSASSQGSRRSIHTVDSDDSGAEADQPARKRKFRRGQPPADDSSPVKPTAAPGSPIYISDSADEAKLKRIQFVTKTESLQEVRRAVEECKGNHQEAILRLESRKAQKGSGRGQPIIIGSTSSSARSSHSPSAVPKSSSSAIRAAPVPAKQPTQSGPSRREEITIDSDEDSEGGYSSEDGGSRDQAEREAAAVRWFNEAAEDTFVDTIGESRWQAGL